MVDFIPHEAPAHEAQALPVMQPSKLVGRDRVLATVYAHLKDNMPVLIYGPAGVGKTTLAGVLASAYTDLPGGVLWLHLHNPDFAELLVRVGRAYDVPEIITRENPLAMVGAVANTLTSHKPLIVLDGQFDPAVAQEFITRCADGLPLLLLADEQIVGPWAAVQLTRLDPDQAAALFKHLTAAEGPESEENDADVDNLVTTLDNNPFAITVAAGAVIASKQSPADFRAALPKQAGVAGPLLALTTSFRTLNSALQGLVLMLGATFYGEASNELLSMVSGAPQEGIRQAMLLLVQRGLAQRFTRYNSTVYRLHPIVHAFAQPLLRGSGKLDSLRAKVRENLLKYAENHSGSSDNDYNLLAVELDSMMALARWSAEDGDLDTVRQLALTLTQAGDFVTDRGYVHELVSLQRLAASSTAAFPAYNAPAAPLPYEDVEEDADDESEAMPAAPLPMDDLTPDDDEAEPEPTLEDNDDEIIDEDDDNDDFYPSLPYDLLGEEDDYDEDDEEDEDVGYAPVKSDISEDSTLMLDMPAEEDEATEAETEAEPEPEGEPEPESTPETPEPPEMARLRASLTQARQQLNQHRQAELLSQMGQTLVAAQMENEAIGSFSEALTIYEELEDRSGMLRTLETLAALTARTQNSQAAVLYATRGVQVAEQTGDKARQMRLLSILGDARQQLGETEQSIGAYNLALDAAREHNNPEEEAQLLLRIGYAQLDDNRAQNAVTSWEAALELFKAQEKRDLEGRVLGGLGTAYGELGRWTEAIAFHTAALFIAREVGDRDEEGLQLSNLGYASVQAQQLGQAVLRYRQALHLAYESGDRENTVSILTDLVNLLIQSPRHLRIVELLVDEAMRLDPNDRNVRRLKERVDEEIQAASQAGVQWSAVSGTVQDYAANAYKLLES
jgi:tetratricopeptide (TPR) repeat protein